MKVNGQKGNAKYNKQLADSLGADDYGMKIYGLVILKPCKPVMEDKKRQTFCFWTFAEYWSFNRDRKIGCGRTLKKECREYDGILILNVKTIEAAAILLETDPAIKSKMLDPELF